MSDRPGLSYPPVGKDIIGTNGLGVIFHYIQMIDICQSHNRLHIAGLSEQVDGHDRLCPFRNSPSLFSGQYAESSRASSDALDRPVRTVAPRPGSHWIPSLSEILHLPPVATRLPPPGRTVIPPEICHRLSENSSSLSETWITRKE